MLLWMLVAFVLAYYAFIAFDFFTHPFAAGTNATVGAPYLFRWMSFVAGTFTVLVALFIISRVRGNIVGPLLLIYGVGAAGWSVRLEWESVTQLAWSTAVFNLYFFALAVPAFISMLFYFPTGQAYPPRLERWVPWLGISMGIAGVLTSVGTPPTGPSGVPRPLYNPLFEPLANLHLTLLPFALLLTFVTVFLRYRHGGTRERLQLKWVLWLSGMVIALSFILSTIPPTAVIETWIEKASALFRVIVYLLSQSFAAFAFGIAILRHKLWDIDIIIRRTLQYSLLSGLLALVYFGGIVILQSLFSTISNQQSPIILVLSTLAIAALFLPLRRRVQDFIDKRFYRRKYDAAKVVADFAATARDETDLDALTARLVEVVDETMQPESVGLWLKPTQTRPDRFPNPVRSESASQIGEQA